MARAIPAPLLVVSAALVYLLMPGHSQTWLTGRPLGPIGLSVLVALGLLVFAAWPLRSAGRGPARLAGALALLAILKLATGLVAPSYGLAASYFAKPGAFAPPERSTDFVGVGTTRVDRSLNFVDDTFPLHFFNDNLRFNYYHQNEPDRQSLAFAVRWQGLLQVPSAGRYPVWLTTIGTTHLDLAGATFDLAGADRAVSVEQKIELSAGTQPLELEYVRRAGAPALLRLEWDPGTGRRVLAAPDLLSRPSSWPPAAEPALLLLARVFDLIFAATLIVFAWLLLGDHGGGRERALLALLLAVVFCYAVVTSLPLHGRVILLDGGADWLTYETYARDILLNGPLMTLGKGLGKGRAFFFQPLYPYVLAGFHWLTGEDLFGPVVLQLFGCGVAAVLAYYVGRQLFGRLAGGLTLALVLGLIGPLHFDWIARRLLSENIYFWLLPATALALLTLAVHASRGLALFTGLLLGLDCVTRGPTLAWIPCALFVLYVELRRGVGRRRAFAVTGLTALACASVVVLVPLRNALVSGQPSLVATNGMATMELAHPIPATVDLRSVEKIPLYRALKLDFSIVQMIEFVRQDPAGYVATLVPLGLYTLGWPAVLEPGSPPRWELIGMTVLYLAYLSSRLLGRCRPRAGSIPPGRTRGTALLHSFILLHFLVMLVFLPNSYGYRQVLPMYLFLAIFAGQFLTGMRFAAAGSPLQQRQGHSQRDQVEQRIQRTAAAARHEELT
jgi:hypothetical protein